MAELASLQIKVVRDGIEQAQKALNDLAKAADNAEKGAGGVGKGFDGANAKTKSFISEMKGLAGIMAAGGIAAGFYNIGKAALSASAEMEQNKVAFSTMLGSAEKANTLLQQMTAFAAATPFQLPEIVTAGKQMLAFGFQSGEVINNLRMLGDVSAGLSVPVGDMVYLFGQIKTQGKAMTQDLMQFANRGIPIYEELGKVLGVSSGQVKDFASQGKIGFNEINQVFVNLTKSGSKFGGMMEAQSKTLAGQWSNFNDTLGKTAVLLGDQMSGDASEVLKILGLMVDSYNKNLEAQKNLSNETERMPSYLELTRKWLDGTYSKQNELNELNYVQARTYGKIQEWQKGNVQLSQQELRWIQASVLEREKEIALLDEKSFINTKQNDIEMQRINSDKDRIKKQKEDDKGKGKDDSLKDMQYAIDIMNKQKEGIAEVNLKYAEQMNKLQELKEKYKGNADMIRIFDEAQQSSAAQNIKDVDELKKKLESFDTVIKKTISDGLIKGLDLTSESAMKLAVVLGDMSSALINSTVSASVSAFNTLGKAFGEGASGAEAFGAAIADFADQLLKTLPTMFIQAGLMAMANGNMATGWTLIGMGLSTSFINGLKEGMQEKDSEDSAHGNVFGFARGGSFTNEITNSPTHFQFSKGGSTANGRMGELGIEAVVPLKRMSNGNLGVESSGGGGEVNITIVNNTSESVDVQKSTGQSGTDITVTIGAIVNKGIASGAYDNAMKYRYNISQKGV